MAKKAGKSAKAAPKNEAEAIEQLSKTLEKMGAISDEFGPEAWGDDQGYAAMVFGRGPGGGRAVAEVSLRKNADGTWRLVMEPMTWICELVEEAGFKLAAPAW